MKGSKLALLSASALALSITPSLAKAQTVPADVAEPSTAATDQTDNQLTDIIVTAQRTETSAQRTPISIQTYTGEQLAERGVANVRALTQIDPSVNITTSSGLNVIAIRGIASSNATEIGEPAVGFGIDGIFNNRSYSLGSVFYDVSRVEILRGPQGTLFGRNTTGGIVNLITNRPTDTFSGGAMVDVGNYSALNIEGFINVPLSSTLSARASFTSRNRTGYRGNTLPYIDQRYDDEDVKSGRLQLLFKPTSDLTIWVSASKTHEGGAGGASETVPFRYAATVPVASYYKSGAGQFEWLHTVPPGLSSDGKNFPYYGPSIQDVNTSEIKGSVTWNFTKGITLTYLGGYNYTSWIRGSSVNISGPFMPRTYVRREFPKTFSSELRLASDANAPFTWQIGAIYFSERSHLYSTMVQNLNSATQTLIYVFDDPRIFANSKAVFGQASWNITDVFKLTGGVRYTDDHKQREGIQRIGVAMTPGASQNGIADSNKITWLGGLDINVTPRNLIYAKVSNGYKAGGFTSNGQYRPETVTSYEIGSKNRFFDNRLQFNIDAYVMKFVDQQVNQYAQIVGTAFSAATTVNAGKSTIKGIEASLSGLTPLGQFDVAANFLDAKYDQFIQAAPWDSTKNINLSGNTLPLAPKLSMSASWRYDINDVAGGRLTQKSICFTKAGFTFSQTNFPDQYQRAYTTFDASLTFETGSKNWQIQAYVKNLTDKKIYTLADETSVYYVYWYSYAPPRTYGVRLTARF